MAAIEARDISGGTGAITAGLAFDSAGEGSPHLLFLHGWCGDRSFFAPQFDHFSSTHRVVSVDLPGHGKSRAPTANTIEALPPTWRHSGAISVSGGASWSVTALARWSGSPWPSRRRTWSVR
jgi:pimeloyl-ACP methyl ester carboxylesterase